MIVLHEEICEPVKPARVLGIALNTRGIPDDALARSEIERAVRETQLPVYDLVRFGADAFYAAIASRIAKRNALSQEKIA